MGEIPADDGEESTTQTGALNPTTTPAIPGHEPKSVAVDTSRRPCEGFGIC